LLKVYPNAKFRIEGYTDSEGTDLFNQKLSQARADLVRNTLIKQGMNENNLVAVGFGENNPIASNETAAGKAENRRVVIVVIR
jgi:OOP family OmpA-OmpF porin